jgi:hypothetical protein
VLPLSGRVLRLSTCLLLVTPSRAPGRTLPRASGPGPCCGHCGHWQYPHCDRVAHARWMFNNSQQARARCLPVHVKRAVLRPAAPTSITLRRQADSKHGPGSGDVRPACSAFTCTGPHNASQDLRVGTAPRGPWTVKVTKAPPAAVCGSLTDAAATVMFTSSCKPGCLRQDIEVLVQMSSWLWLF